MTDPGLYLLVVSPRVAPGVLSRDAWLILQGAHAIYARRADDPVSQAVAEAGLAVTERPLLPSATGLAKDLLAEAAHEAIVWLPSPEGDLDLTDAVAAEATFQENPPSVEVVVGSWDVPGSRLLDAVAVMDRLRSPGGCPWDAEQTHESLAPYLLEETHEALDVLAGIAEGRHTLADFAGELGDVLLQVLFHARVAEEAEDGFDIDEVAGQLIAKLVRRHPHVFGDVEASTPEQVEANWESIKAEERAERAERAGNDEDESDEDDLLHGIPASLPALQTAQKVLSRRARRGLTPLPGEATDLGDRLLALVEEARGAGTDAELALRAAARRIARE